MSAQQDVLREFLAKLGFKVDDASYRRFTDSINAATKRVVALGATVEGAALAIEALAVRYAASGDKMYWASQRIGASSKNIQRFQYEISQLGGSAEGARSSLQAFSDFLRTYPGARQLGARFGLDPNKFKDTAEYAEALLQQLGKLSPSQQKLWSQMFGFDLDTTLAGGRDIAKYRAEYDRTLRSVGLNQDDLTRKSTSFMQNIRRLELDAQVIGEKVFSDLLTKYGPKLDQMVASLNANLPAIAQKIEDVVDRILKLSDSIEKGVQSIGGWKTVFEGVLVYVGGSWLLGMLGAIGKVRLALGLLPAAGAATASGAATAAGVGAGGATVLAGGAAAATVGGMAYILNRFFPGRPGQGDHPGQRWQSTGRGGYWVTDSNWSDDAVDMVGGSRASGGRVPRGIRNNNPGNIKYGTFARAQGATGQDADGFAIFPDMATGQAAAAALLSMRINSGTNTISGLISSWAPSNENKTGAYINFVAKQLGVAADKQLGADRIGDLQRAIFSMEVGSRWASQLGNTALGSAGGASKSVTVNNDVDIHVAGSSDPGATARATASEVNNVNRITARMFAPVAQ